MKTIVGDNNTKKTKEVKTQRIVNVDPTYKVPTNVSQYAVGGSEIKDLENAKHWASEAEKSAKDAASSASKSETFMNITIEAAKSVQDNTSDSFEYLEEIRQISTKIDGQEANIDESEKQVILHTQAAERAAEQADASAAQARDSEANAAASASSANNSAVSAKESEQASKASEISAADSATKAGEKLAQTEAVYDKTIDDVSKAVQSYLKDKGGFDPNSGLPEPDTWVDIFGVRKKLSCMWTADRAGAIPGSTSIPFNEGDILIYNAELNRYGRFSGQLVDAGGGGGSTEFSNDIKLVNGKRLLGTDSKNSTVELIKLATDEIVEAGDKTKKIHLLSKDRQSAFVCVANAKAPGGFDNYQIYHEGNKPTPSDIGAYTKAEADTKFVDVSGDSMTGDLNTTAKVIVKGNEVYHPLNKPTTGDIGAVSVSGNQDITGVKKFTKNVSIENDAPALTLIESDSANTVHIKADSKKVSIGTSSIVPIVIDTASDNVVITDPRSKLAQGTASNSLTRKDYVDSELAKKFDKTGGTVSGNVVVTGKMTIEGTGSVFKDINTTGQIKENNVRVYSPNNKPNAVDVGALPVSGGTIGGSLTVVNNLGTTNGNITEKGQRVYSPNNKPTPADLGASAEIDAWKLRSKVIGDTTTPTDLNDIREVGNYRSTRHNNLIDNKPEGTNGAFLLTVESIAPESSQQNGYIRQTLKPYNTDKTYIRIDGSSSTNPWTEWSCVYSTTNKPTAADVGAIGIDNVYDKAQSDARFWQKTETVNRAFESDKVRSLGYNADGFKGDDSFRGFAHGSSSTGFPTTYGTGIFKGRLSGDRSQGWSIWNSTDEKFPYFGKQKNDGSGFEWFKFYTEANKPTAADVDAYSTSEADARYVNSSGDTMTGQLNANGNIRISRSAPILTLHETDVDKSYMFVADGNSMRLNRNSTGNTTSNLIWQWLTIESDNDGGRLELVNPMSRSTQSSNASALTRKDYVDSQVNTRLPLTGGTLSGDLRISDTKSISLGNAASNSPKITGNGYDLGITSVSDITIHANSDLGTASGDEALNLKAASNNLKIGTTSGLTYNNKNVYTEHSFAVDSNPTSNSVVKRTSTGAIAGTSFVSASNFRVTIAPRGGVYKGVSSVTGSIKITLPRVMSATMLKMYVSVYNYKTDTSFNAVISGYETTKDSLPSWTQTSAIIHGSKETPNHPIYFGHEGGKSCIWIGSIGQAWGYPHVVIDKIETGFGGGNNDEWSQNWSVDVVEALGTIVRTVSDSLLKPGGTANIPSDEQPTANTLVKRNASGEIAAKGRLLIANSNDGDVTAGTGFIDFVSAAGNSYGRVGDIDNTQNLNIKSNIGKVVLDGSDVLYKSNKIYHQGFKPTPADVGAVPASDVAFGNSASGIYNKIPKVAADGVLEVGRIIDFHAPDSTLDFDARIDIGSTAPSGIGRGTLNIQADKVRHNGWDVFTENRDNYMGTGKRLYFPTASTRNHAYIEARNGDANGSNMLIQSGGGMFIGSGESPKVAADNMSTGGGESTYLTSDGAIYLVSGAQNWDSRKTASLWSNGNFDVEGRIKSMTSENSVTMAVGSSDVFLHNSLSNKYLQLRNNGSLDYDSRAVFVDGDSRLDGKIISRPKELGSENLNDIRTAGIYSQSATAETSIEQNYPERNAGSLLVTTGAGIQQRYHVYNSSRVWTRAQYRTADAWTPWAREYNTLNKPSAGDVDALSTSGGTLTGDLTLTNANAKINFTSALNDSLSGFTFTNGAGQNLDVSHVIADSSLPLGGQGLVFKGTGAINHLVTDGDLFAWNNKRVYHEGFKPSANDVGALPITGGNVTGFTSFDHYNHGMRTKVFNQADNATKWDFNYAGFMRTNGMEDGIGNKMPSLMMWCPHSVSDKNGNYGFGIGSNYYGTGLYYYSRNEDGTASKNYQVYHEGFKPTPAALNVLPASGTSTLDGRMVIKSAASHLSLVETDRENKQWHIEVSDEDLAFVETKIASRLKLHKGGNATLSGTLEASRVKSELNHSKGYFTISPYNSGYGTSSFIRGYYREHDSGKPGQGWTGIQWDKYTPAEGDTPFKSESFDMKVGNNYVYHQGRKPTANDVGAFPITGGNLNGGIDAAGGMKAHNFIAKNAVQSIQTAVSSAGNFSTAISAESGYALLYKLHKDAGKASEFIGIDPKSDLRFRKDNGTGDSKYTDYYVYHQGRKPTANDVGALPSGGTAVAANKLATARYINGVKFDGTEDAIINELRGNTYTSGGSDTPQSLGPSRLKYRMVGAQTGSASAGFATYSDALWLSSYGGGDVKRSNLLLMSKDSPRIAFRQADFDATSWGPLYEIYHTGKKPTASDVGALPSGGTAVAANKLATPRAIGGVAFDGTRDITPQHLWYKDTRAVNWTPNSANRADLFTTFQNGDTNGLGTNTHDYFSILHVPRYHDNSGGQGSQFAFKNDSKIRYRQGIDADNWGEWQEVYTTHNKPNATDVGAIPRNTTDGTPVAAFYRTLAQSTVGTKIRLPFSTSGGQMVSFTIRVYQNYQACDVQFSGYLYESVNNWHSPSALVISGTTSIEFAMGRDTDGRAYVWLTGGYYRGVGVFNVTGGYIGGDWNEGWEIVESDDKPNIAHQGTIYPPLYNNGSGGTLTLSNWLRTTGDTGWLNTTYNGGWFMSDSVWIRSYNSANKLFISNTEINAIYTAGGVTADGSVRSHEFRGTGNVDGTGEAINCPAGIYSKGTNWLYGPVRTAGNSIETDGGSVNTGAGDITGGSISGNQLGVMGTSGDGRGLSLYGGASAGLPEYGISFATTINYGTHGETTGDWSTYFTMTGAQNRGWIFRHATAGNVASINAHGVASFSKVNTGSIDASGRITTSAGFSGNGSGLTNIPSASVNRPTRTVLFNNSEGHLGGNFRLNQPWGNFKALIFIGGPEYGNLRFSIIKTYEEIVELQEGNNNWGTFIDANNFWNGRFADDAMTFITSEENCRMYKVVGLS